MMSAKPQTLLYIHNAAKIGGGNKVLLSLMEHLNRERFRPVSILPSRGPMEAELTARGVPFHIVPLQSALAGTRWGAVRCTLAMARVFLRERPALMHANGVLSYRYASFAARATKTRRICHIHHPGEVFGGGWGLSVTPDSVITVSAVMYDEVASYLAQLPQPPGRVVMILNSVDTNAFVPTTRKEAIRAGAGLAQYSHLISIVGSVNEHKGHRLFLQMARRIVDRMPAAGFLVIGDDIRNNGQYRREMEAYARELGLGSNAIFFGFASDETTRELMAASDLFVLPTREEGFGLALAEAQACGVPVVSTRIGPIPQVVADGETGILVPVNDVPALTDAVMSLLGDPEKRRHMGAEGRRRTVELFGPDRYAREMEDLYTQVLG